ncbi:zinc-binding dehydrogenase [Halosegnis marinus]|uniref:Zinc-binding dehydrogenase n=1 Tax=Halosegnis marinus TaxID=3034023 RepID=A0ABD5ZKS9_9EURY|nr:zinc-binding dehydrogenase [Halosegnis sp. DT85]
MEGVFYEEHGDTDVLQYGELPDPEIGRDDVLVDVKAGALNHLDVWTRKGMPSPGEFPHIPGSDAAGVVAEVGPDVTRFEEGDHVAVASGSYCGECEHCRAGEHSECVRYTIIGEHSTGVHSEYASLPEENLVAVPDHVDFETAAAAPLVFQTAWRMLHSRAEIEAGESVLVLGASGGVGHAAVQIADHAGCEVYATGSTEAKLEAATELGADHVVNYEEEAFDEFVEEHTGGRGVDIVVDHIGGPTWEKSMNSLAKGGRIVTCGATAGPKVEVNISELFWNQYDILGSTMGANSDIDEVLDLVWDGTFEPRIRDVLPMSEAATAHGLLEDREGFGKVVVVPDSEL